MKGTERFIVGGLFTMLLLLVQAFIFHTSPRFAGSLAGFALGVAAATLMLTLLVYPLAKYSFAPGSRIRQFISLNSLLAFHVYAAVIGALLGILHTGHHYQSSLGIALVASMLITVVTGFAGRYYLPQTTAELREQQSRLATLRSAYDRRVIALTASDEAASLAGKSAIPEISVLRLVDAIADLEYAIGSRELAKRIFVPWIVLHVAAAIVMYVLLALHIAGEVYFGLRWLS